MQNISHSQQVKGKRIVEMKTLGCQFIYLFFPPHSSHSSDELPGNGNEENGPRKFRAKAFLLWKRSLKFEEN